MHVYDLIISVIYSQVRVLACLKVISVIYSIMINELVRLERNEGLLRDF